MVTQLNPPLPMSCPKGEGFAHFLIDYGPESDLYWVIFITETGEVWTYANKHVRASENITLGRTLAKPAEPAAKPEPESDDSLRNRLLRTGCSLSSKDADAARTAAGEVLDEIAVRYGVSRRIVWPKL